MLIDPKSSTPIFRQIVSQLRDLIRAGVYRKGESLPSVRSLAIEIKVNPNTVQRAYEDLERQGVVEKKRGVGVFVVDRRLVQLSGADRQLAQKLLRCIQQGGKAGMTPDAIRSVFETALQSYVRGSRLHD